MSVIRQARWLGQMRVDAPHLRAADSSVAADFDFLAGQVLAGARPFVVQGFAVAAGALGGPATSVQLAVASGQLLHPTATASGTLFAVAAGRTVEVLSAANPRLQGSFTAGTVNYVGVDLVRAPDDSTVDLVQFLDVDTDLEEPEEVALAQTLDYAIVVSTTPFASTTTLAPICKITTDASGNVTAVEDARSLLCRLGKGGSITNARYAYPWPGGRTEIGDNTDFSAGDKSIFDLKDWLDAAMTRLWELGGGERWYSPTADRNVQLTHNGTTLFTNGEYFEWTGSNLHWRELRIVFDNSTGWFNDVTDQLTDSPGQTDLADGQCVYVDLDRTANATLVAQKATISTLGAPLVPGARWVLAWRVGSNVFTRDNMGYAVGVTFVPATTTSTGVVKLLQTPGAPGAPMVFNPDANGGLTFAASGGNRTALIVTGNGSGAGVSAAGGATGNALVTNEVTSNTAPQYLPKDLGGNARGTLVDHLGFPTFGNLGVFREVWDRYVPALSVATAPITNSDRWSFYVNPNGNLAAQAPTANYPKAQGKLLGVATVGAFSALTTAEQQVFLGSTISLVLEWDALPVYTFGCAVDMGIDVNSTSGNFDAATSYVRFNLASNGAQWHAQAAAGGSQTDVATGVVNTGANAVLTRFRIEYFGAGSAVGATTAKFYINGALVATITTNLPTGVAAGFTFQLLNPPGTGAPNLLLGTINACWPLALNPSNQL